MVSTPLKPNPWSKKCVRKTQEDPVMKPITELNESSCRRSE